MDDVIVTVIVLVWQRKLPLTSGYLPVPAVRAEQYLHHQGGAFRFSGCSFSIPYLAFLTGSFLRPFFSNEALYIVSKL